MVRQLRDYRKGNHEESPSIERTGCWLTASGGDPKESATEIYFHCFGSGKGEKAV